MVRGVASDAGASGEEASGEEATHHVFEVIAHDDIVAFPRRHRDARGGGVGLAAAPRRRAR